MRGCKALAFWMALFLVAGCSTLPHKVDLLYKPTASIKGGKGTIYIAAGRHECNSGGVPVRWVVGSIQDGNGNAVDEIVSSIAPYDLVSDAFKRELESAGYTVVLSDDISKENGAGIRLGNAKVSVTEVPSYFSVDSKAEVSASLELWLSGAKVKQEEFNSGYSESYPRTEDRLQHVLQKSLEGLTTKAIPDIVRSLKR